MLVTTTPGIEGRPVTGYLGIVTAQGVLGVNAFKDVSAGMRNIFGGRARSYEAVWPFRYHELGPGPCNSCSMQPAGLLHCGGSR
jgi:hypothetical protein